MREPDADRLWRAIIADGDRRRVHLEDLYTAHTRAFPDRLEGGRVRHDLHKALDVLRGDGRARWSVGTDRTGTPHLPRFIDRTDIIRPTPKDTDWRRVAWHPDLAWVPDLPRRPNRQQLSVLTAVNHFLPASRERPIVPHAERSLELFGDEKAISNRAGGNSLWQPDRLGPDLLRFSTESPPMVLTQTGHHGSNVLIVENHATWRSITRALAQLPRSRWSAVCFGHGHLAQTSAGWLTERFGSHVTAEYFGDLDHRGVQIAVATAARGAELGVEIAPAIPLFELLLDHGIRASCPTWTLDQDAVRWFGPSLASAIADRLDGQHRMAQEAVGYELLSSTDGWAD